MDKTSLYGILVGVVGLVLAYISHLRSKNQSLEGKVGGLQSEKTIRESLFKQEEAKSEADIEEARYLELKRKYLNDNGGEGGTA